MNHRAHLVALVGLASCGRNGFDTGMPDSGLAVDAVDSTVIDPSLVAHFTMDDDPTDGDLDDATGTRRAVCLINVTCGTSTDGKVGTALHLQDLQFYRVPYDAALAADGSFTIAAWARATVAASSILVTKRYSLIHNTWGLDADDMGNVAFEGAKMTTMVSSTYLMTSQPISLGAWMHLAVTYDGAVRRGYINGFRVGTDTVALLADAGEIVIGADDDDGNVFGHYTGDLDDLRIYNRALDDAEIATLGIP